MRRLNVWWDGRLVGGLTQDNSGDLGFAYEPTWVAAPDAPPLSISLPKQTKLFKRSECRPFFAGLLPDEKQRTGAAKALGVSEANDFALLDGMGGDVAGALQLLPDDQPAPTSKYSPQTKILTKEQLVDVLNDLPMRPLLAGDDGLRLSLAGAQSKVPVVLINKMVALPAPGQPTTHILKPPIASLPGTTENEAAVMSLARAAGLDAARVEPRVVGDRTFLLITRYDRVEGTSGDIRRLHQEDFCQALGIPPDHKYASEGGPVFKNCFDLLRRVSNSPARDVLRLFDAAIFNLIVGNADAHGKNFSLLYSASGTHFAPLYDLLSTVEYPSLATKSAMKIGRASNLADLSEENWRRFAKDIGLGIPYLRRRVSELSENLRNIAGEVCLGVYVPGLDAKFLSQLGTDIARRAEIIALKVPNPSRDRSNETKILKTKKKVKLSVGNSKDFHELSSSTEGKASQLLYVKILNETDTLITGGSLAVKNVVPAIEMRIGCCLARNITLTPKLSKRVPLASCGDSEDGHMLFQCQKAAGFLSPPRYGLLHRRHTFDLRFESDQGFSAEISCVIYIGDNKKMMINETPRLEIV